jgi:two-component flavin-dependent monooxygenase/oxygenase LndZ5
MPNRTLTSTSLLTEAEGLAVGAARCAADAETNRRLDPEMVQSLIAAGFARHFVPVDCGGNAASFAELSPAVSAIGEGCAATAWCASLMANMARMAAYLPADGYREVWASGPDVFVVGSLTPVGKAQPVTGGWRVSGQWAYISAVDYSDWALVCAQVPSEGAPESMMFAVPRSAYRIVDTWFNVGMRATGSNTLVLEDFFVPAERAFDRKDLFTGRAVDSEAACHSVPLQAANGLSFATPVLGAARGSLNSWSAYVAEKLRTSRPGAPGMSRISYDVTLARSAGEIEAAELLLGRAADIADRGAAVTTAETVQNLRDCSLAVEMLVTAVNRLFNAAGTTGHSAANPIQRFWRDVNSAASHVALQFEPAASAYSGQFLTA